MVLAAPGSDEILLRPPTTAEASTIGGWSRSGTETAMWCSSRVHPVTAAQVVAWWEPSDVAPFVAAYADSDPVAYGELWFEPADDEVELARLIVAPDRRGRGVGRRLVAALVEKALESGLSSVILRLDGGNRAALRCYLASGFQLLDPYRNAEWNKGQPATYAWMELGARGRPRASG